MKNFNMSALRGEDTYTDEMFQSDMRESGVDIPDSLLHTPEMNDFVANAMREQNIRDLPSTVNPDTGELFTTEEATKAADAIYKNVVNKARALNEMK